MSLNWMPLYCYVPNDHNEVLSQEASVRDDVKCFLVTYMASDNVLVSLTMATTYRQSTRLILYGQI